MKTKLFFISMLVILGLSANAQVPDYAWVKVQQGHGNVFSNTVDQQGNVYITGYFNSSTYVLGTCTLNQIGSDLNLFVAKYSPSGDIIWAKNAAAICWNVSHQGSMSPVTVDNSGNVYVSGTFRFKTAIFGTDTLYNADTTGTALNIFFIKYDKTGNLIWAKSYGINNFCIAYSLANDANGNIFMTGSFAGDSIKFDTTILTNHNNANTDIFLTKFDSTGKVIWAKDFGGDNEDEAWGVAVDASGNSFISGYFESSKCFIGNDTLIHNSYNDNLLIAKFDPNGNTLWAKSATSIGGTMSDDAVLPYNMAVDNSGNAYLTGSFFSPEVIIGSTTLMNSDEGSGDVFLVKYDANGNVLWVRYADGVGDDRALSVAVSRTGDSYITGYFNSYALTFGSYNLSYLNSSSNCENLFLVKYDSSGNVGWAKKLGSGMSGTNCDGISVTVDKNYGDIYLSGWQISDTLHFDTITSINQYNSFLAKIYGSCSAYFSLYPDTSTLHHYYAVNMATGIPPIKYLWSWGDGTTDTIAFPSHTYAVAGYYNICLTITDSTGCTQTYCDSTYLSKHLSTMIYVNVVPHVPTGIIESHNSCNSISLYPNPANNNITIESTQQGIIEITNIQGQLIETIATTGNKTTIDVSAFAKGMYFVKVTTEKGFVVKKFIKE